MSSPASPAKGWRSLLLVLAGLVLAGGLALGAWVTWQRPHSAALALPEVPEAVDKSLGINVDLSRLGTEQRQRVLAAVAEGGYRWLRLRFAWDVIEPERDSYDWSVWDGIVRDITGHNIRLIAVLDGSPAWARAGEDAGNPLAPPQESRDFGDFAAALAERYGDWIDHYQIWDEPNIAPHWGAREVDPAAYARLLREGAIRVRAADPGAAILAAALAPNVEPGGANMSDLLFLDALYQQGAAEWFDVVAAQPYDFGETLDSPPDSERLNWSRPVLLRQVMENWGDDGVAVWAVAFGLQDAAPESVSGAVEGARQEWPWLGPMLWAAWSPEDPHGEYAMAGADGALGPAYGALQALATAPAVAWPGVYPADHPSGSYEGDWRVTPSGADIGGSGDRLRIAFQGTRLDLKVRRGAYRAFLFVSVDGEPANALPRDGEGRAYVVLYDPLGSVESVTLARGLSDGQHQAEIVADRGWGQWAIAGWASQREGSERSPWLPTMLALAALLLLGATIHLSWPHRDGMLATCAWLRDRYRALDDRLVLVITGGAALLAYAMVGVLPTLAALSLLALLLLLRPMAGLPLIALALPFYQLGRPLLGKVFSMVEILTLLTALGWGLNRLLAAERGRIRINGWEGPRGSWLSRLAGHISQLSVLDWGVLALVLVGSMSLLWAEQARVAAREFRTVILEAAIFYGLLRAMVREQGEAWRMADAWVLGGGIIALVGIFQWALGQNLITAEGVWRVRGFYGSPNNLALYLGRVFPLAVAVAVFSTSSFRAQALNSGGGSWRRRLAYGAAAAVMGVALLLTYSRGAWLLGVPISLLFLAGLRSRRALVVVLAGLLAVALLGLVMVGVGRLTSLLDATEGTTFFRLQLWQSSWAMIRDHPFWGVGLDNFLYQYRSHYVLPTAWEEFDLSHPHNFLFDFWLRLGILGLVALFWILVAFFRQGWRAYRRWPQGNDRLLALGLMAGMVNFVAHGLVDNAFFLVDLAYAFVLMLALVQVASAVRNATSDAPPGKVMNDIGGE